MGRKGIKTNHIKSIVVSINNITVRIPLNKDELIEDKKEAKEALQLSSIEFKKVMASMRAKKNELSRSRRKLKEEKKVNQEYKLNNDHLILPSKSSNCNIFTNTQLINREDLLNTQILHTNVNKTKMVDVSENDQYESQIISDWDRLWENNNNNNDDPNTYI
mgnify:CR=1 FL=1